MPIITIIITSGCVCCSGALFERFTATPGNVFLQRSSTNRFVTAESKNRLLYFTFYEMNREKGEPSGKIDF